MKTARSLLLLIAVAVVGAAVWLQLDLRTTNALYADKQLRMELVSLQPYGRLMEEASFQIRIAELPDKPLTAADIRLTIYMPDIFCGTFPAALSETSPGVYSATVVPAMQGTWRAEATLFWDMRHIQVSSKLEVR